MLLLILSKSSAVAVQATFEFPANGGGGTEKSIADCVPNPWKGGSSSRFRDWTFRVVPVLLLFVDTSDSGFDLFKRALDRVIRVELDGGLGLAPSKDFLGRPRLGLTASSAPSLR